ncbi:MAG: tripartite tricarboxylate transporter TctB family protein [Alphaproteobacteria bacterium]
MTRVNRDTVVAILLLVGCGVLLNASFDIREPDYGQLSPAAWPRTIVGVLTFLSLIYLVQSIRRGVPSAPVEAEGTTKTVPRGVGEWIAHWRNVFWVFALFLAYLLTMPWLGMLVGGMAFVFLLLNALGGWSAERLALHAVIAAISVGGMWSVFTFGLGVLLPRGEFFGWF